ENDRISGPHRTPVRTVHGAAEGHVATGVQGHVRTQLQCAVVLLVAAGADVACQVDGRGPRVQAVHPDRAQGQRTSVGDLHRVATQVDRADEVVAGVAEDDVAAARIETGVAAHAERVGLGDVAFGEGHGQVATYLDGRVDRGAAGLEIQSRQGRVGADLAGEEHVAAHIQAEAARAVEGGGKPDSPARGDDHVGIQPDRAPVGLGTNGADVPPKTDL